MENLKKKEREKEGKGSKEWRGRKNKGRRKL